MNKIFNGRNIVIALITLIIGVFVALGASKLIFNKSTTVTGNVISFILNPKGKVEGAILDTGDQIKFGAETGEVVSAILQIGSALTATGYAGTNSDYGREFHAQTLQIGEQVITIAGKPKNPRNPKDGEAGKGRRKEDRPAPPRPPRDEECPNNEMSREDSSVNNEIRDENAPGVDNSSPEIAQVSGNVKYILVNREGKARGVILSGGEQLNLGREVENTNLSIDTNTSVTTEGEIPKSQFGSFIKPNVLTIGNQTFTFNR